MTVMLMLAGLLSGMATAEEKSGYLYGNMEYYSTVSGEYISNGYYYTDQWFQEDASVRNDSLALVSAQLSSAAVDDTHAVSFLKKLGFNDAKAQRYDSLRSDDCAYTIGSKHITKNGADCTLISVAFQGSQYGDKGWQQNVSVNSDTDVSGDHAAYSAAAEIFQKDLSSRNIHGEVIVWLTGHSRGGAIADLAAAYLLNRKDPPAVFAFTFGCPATTSKTEEAGSAKYNGIHNYLCEEDPLAMLPIWDMNRYGQTVLYGSDEFNHVTEKLAELNPDAYTYAQEYNPTYFDDNVTEYLQNLKDRLTETVPSRQEYSKKNTDSFTANGKKKRTIEYSYQKGMGALCHIVFEGGEDFSGRLRSLMDDQTIISNLVYSYLEESFAVSENPENKSVLLNDAAQKRWTASDQLYRLTVGDSDNPLYCREDLYALLKILSPLIIAPGAAENEEKTLPSFDEDFEALDYLNLMGILNFTDGVKTLLYPHHSDMIIARLKLLAPDPGKKAVSDCRRDESCPVSRFTDASPESWYHDGVHWVLDRGIMNGTGEERFAPADSTTRAMVVTMLWRMENRPKVDSVSAFRDVPEGQWYTEAVNWAAANEIVEGYDSDFFGTSDHVTREQIVTILYRYSEYQGVDTKIADKSALNRYKDGNHVSGWAADAFCRALDVGIIQGFENGWLSPEADATRAQIAVMIMRYAMTELR